MVKDSVMFFEGFEGIPQGGLPGPEWWVEGGEKVWVDNGRLRVQANPLGERQPGNVCTVWHKQVFSGDVRVEFETCVLDSTIDANNINFFLFYTDPAGDALFDSRAGRADGGYAHYHELNGYIFTFLNDRQGEGAPAEDGGPGARVRMRRCPGFSLLTETYAYHCRKNRVYHVEICKRGGDLRFSVDGKLLLEGYDERPWSEGVLGLRTFQTDLWWDNIRVTRIGKDEN